MTGKQNAPEIRFEGFTDPWEQRKLGELGFAQSGIGFPDAEQGGTEGTPFFKVSDMNTSGNEYELVASNNYVTAEQIARMGWRPINRVPAIFFAKVGAAVMLNRKRLVNEPFLLDNNTMAFSMDSSLLDTQFGQSLFERLDLTSLIQVGALPSFNSSDVESISVSLPSTMNEQRQIGQYLCDLNTLITLHQRKYDKLCTVKKSMLDKMFPKPGETEPEIRFEGFTDPWEQRKLGELLLERNEQAPQSDQYPLMAFIANQGIAPKGDRYDRSALINDVEGKFYKRTKKGDFIYSSNNLETGSIGLNKYGNACISPVYSIFQPSGITDSDFLGRRLVRKDFIHEMVKWRQGVIYGQWRIHEADFLRLNIAVPSVNEQRLIGKLLDNLDSLITLHQRKLELLRDIKKSLLDRMFV